MGKNKYKGLRSYSQGNITAPERIKRGGKVETLSYINADEARLLKRYGGSGARTKYGVRSYFNPPPSADDNGNGDEEETSFGSNVLTAFGFDEDRQDAALQVYDTVKEKAADFLGITTDKAYAKMTDEEKEKYDALVQERRDANKNYVQPTEASTTSARDEVQIIDNPAPAFDLQELYSKRNDPEAMQEYIDQYKEREVPDRKPTRNSSGGTTTYKYAAVDTGIPDDFADMSNEDRWYKDNDGRILGWQNKDGMPGFANKNQWQFDEDEDTWVFVGEGSVAGGGGKGTTQALDPDTGEATIVGARTYADMIGYDKNKLQRAEADRGAQVEKLKTMAEKYGGKYDDKTGEFLGGGLEEKFLSQSDQYDKEVAKMYGLDVQKKKMNPDGSPALDATGQPIMETVKGDTFWKDMEDEAGKLPTDLQARLYGKRADDITAGETEQTADLQRMMAERGIDPSSPQAMRMRQQVKSGTRTAQRQARRESLGDAMAVQQQQMQQRLGVRGARLAGMESQGSRMFSQGAHYGAKSQEIGGLLLEEATDRQRGQQGMQLAGLQMRMAKEKGDKDTALAKKIADMKASHSGGGGNNALGKAFAGGVSGYMKGGWAGATAGALKSVWG